MGRDEAGVKAVDERVRALLDAGNTSGAVAEALRVLGPDVHGFLYGVLRSDADADDVLAMTSERLWKSFSTFDWRCSLRTWFHVIAGREMLRFRRDNRRYVDGHLPIAEIEEVIAAVRTETRSRQISAQARAVDRLREELSEEDRMLLVLRVDRRLPWENVAQTFLDDPDASDEAKKREAARLRQRFHLIKARLAKRARDEGLLPG